MIKYASVIWSIICSISIVHAQKADTIEIWKKAWKQLNTGEYSANTILNIYHDNQKQIGDMSDSQILNTYFFIQKSGEYFIKNKGEVHDKQELLRQLPEIDLSSSGITNFMDEAGHAQFINYYFMLKALREGATFEEARDGVELTTEFPCRALNRYDYDKLKCIFLEGSLKLQTLYLEKMKFIFRNNGCTDGLSYLQPLIAKHIPDMPVKQEIRDLYARYTPIRSGHPAPLSVLLDANGKQYNWSDFAGKIIVVDIWATWCCSCIDGMPHFLELGKEYASHPDVVFLSLSIDRKEAWEKWKEALITNRMTPLLNLIAVSGESSFESDYCITGVPRCMVIDKKGNIVDAYAPLGKGLRELIERTLKN